uniref:EZH inhibitory protein n=1 Tax=Balaenoptera musculus TaxID=9771 RepID=A0A8C0DLD8_BALMU
VAAQSCCEKEQKPQQGEMPAGPKNEVASAPGDTRGTENPNPGALVPTVSSNPSPSGGGAPRGGTAGSSSCKMAAAGAISLTGEDPGPPSVDGVQEGGRPDLHGGGSPHAELSCVVPRMGQGVQTVPVLSGAAVWQAARGAGQRPTQTTSPGKGRGRKRPSGEEASRSLKLPRRCLFSGAAVSPWSASSPPSSPRSEPSSCGPALRSQAVRAGPALCRRATQSGPAVRSRPAHRRRRASAPGPASRRRASEPGPAIDSHSSPPDPALRRRRASAPGPAHRRRRASAPGPASRRRASGPPGPALRPVLRGRASGPSPTLGSRAAQLGPTLQSSSTTPGFVLWSPATQGRSAPSSHPSPPGLNGQSPPSSPGVALRRLVFQSSSSSSDSEVPNLASQQVWHAVRMRASSPSPPGPYGESSSSSFSSSAAALWFPDQSTSSSPTAFSGRSSPRFPGLSSISIPSPASLRHMLLPDFEALSLLSSGEPAEIGSMPPSPTSPML